jgi:hypothetical protein
LDRFIKGHQPDLALKSPDERVRSFFERSSEGRWILIGGEDQRYECKREFNAKKLTHVVRSIAALANNNGGFILFGVSNNPFQIEGIGEEFEKTDIVQIVEKTKAHLSPTPRILAKGTVKFGQHAIGYLQIEKHTNPPIIVSRDGDGLNEGEILFRYPGQSARIKFGDLRALLDERDRRAQVALANAAGRLAEVGTNNALILDTDKNVLEAKGHAILIDQKLAESLKFIREGEFDETKGAPTLKLMGEVAPVAMKGTPTPTIVHAAIFPEHILEKFLEQAKVEEPVQYIYAGLAQSRQWLPIFYYARMSGMTNAQISEFVEGLRVSQKGKKRILVERLAGRKVSFSKPGSQVTGEIAKKIAEGRITVPSSITEVAPFTRGLVAIKSTKSSMKQLLAALRRCKEIAQSAEDGNALGAIFKAACRVDELFFSA